MKYYCVLKIIVNFENFIDTFKTNLEVLKIFNKICKTLTKL